MEYSIEAYHKVDIISTIEHRIKRIWLVIASVGNLKSRHTTTQLVRKMTVSDKVVCTALRTQNLKEIFIVRYAERFKIFCRNYKDAKYTKPQRNGYQND